jgi:hypothetical protein
MQEPQAQRQEQQPTTPSLAEVRASLAARSALLRALLAGPLMLVGVLRARQASLDPPARVNRHARRREARLSRAAAPAPAPPPPARRPGEQNRDPLAAAPSLASRVFWWGLLLLAIFLTALLLSEINP